MIKGKKALTLAALVTTCCAPVLINTQLDLVALYSDRARREIREEWEKETKGKGLEYALCLHGRVIPPDGVYIAYTKKPISQQQWPDSVHFTCENTGDYIGAGHSHPKSDIKGFDSCIFSAGDIVSFLGETRNKIYTVFCTEERLLTEDRPFNEDSVYRHMKRLYKRTPVTIK